MTSFRVDNMTCGHCTAAITQALQGVDPNARIKVNPPSHQVDIDSAAAGVSRLRDAIESAGYPAVLLDGAAATAGQPAQRKSGCCCG